MEDDGYQLREYDSAPNRFASHVKAATHLDICGYKEDFCANLPLLSADDFRTTLIQLHLDPHYLREDYTQLFTLVKKLAETERITEIVITCYFPYCERHYFCPGEDGHHYVEKHDKIRWVICEKDCPGPEIRARNEHSAEMYAKETAERELEISRNGLPDLFYTVPFSLDLDEDFEEL